MKRLEAKIFGDVQGVSFRVFAVQEAEALGLVGYVWNLRDGSVEVIAEGEEDTLKKLLGHLQEKHPFARVERVEQLWKPETGEFSDFSIR